MEGTNADVVIVGDGPAGLSAALILGKNGLQVDVLGGDESPVHLAHLYNYLGVADKTGPDFLTDARAQCEKFHVRLHKSKVSQVKVDEQSVAATSEGGARHEGRYLVLATGRDASLAASLGLKSGPDGILVDARGRTSLGRVYAGGRIARGHMSQVASSVGDGAAIALDILSVEKGKPFHDYDTLSKTA